MSSTHKAPSKVDPRNQLNDLPNKEWLKLTKSVWRSVPGPRDALKKDHPATFAETDVVKLVRFFTKRGEPVLDPFCGTGSTLLASLAEGRPAVGVELVERWASVARTRVARFLDGSSQVPPALDDPESPEGTACTVLQGDAREVLPELPAGGFPLVVTSPPYWHILRKSPDHKTRQERLAHDLSTHYSERPDDLGNLPDYPAFLAELGKVFAECHRVQTDRGHLAVIVSDFRHGSRFVVFHADLIRVIEPLGYALRGITVLLQDNKTLYPYGMPYSFVSNIHHQYILIFRRIAGQA